MSSAAYAHPGTAAALRALVLLVLGMVLAMVLAICGAGRVGAQDTGRVLRAGLPAGGAASTARDAVFGSVAFPVREIAVSRRFRAIVDADPAGFVAGCLAEESRCATDVQRRLRLLAPLRDADGRVSIRMLREVNRTVNTTIRYQTDPVAWGQDDYWATPQETATRGVGDCEDFALLKMAALQAFGMDAASMTIVVLQDLRRGIGHAVLAVRTDGVEEILDNLTDAVKPDTEVVGYRPLFSIGSAGAFVHGVRRPVPVASLDARRTAPSPGLRGSLN
ncbi:transglutaminase-like cysteine peptidase [Alsobacter sp. R-9]